MRSRTIGDLGSRLGNRSIVWAFLAAAIVAALLFVGLLQLTTPGEESRLRVEAGRALIQVIAVVVLGAALALTRESYRERRQRAQRAHEYRADMHGRVVKATNVLRKAGSRIAADRSVETWGEQMLAVIDAGQELRVIRHESDASANLSAPQPFTQQERALIDELLSAMFGYVDSLDDEFRLEKKRLSDDKQRDRWEELRKLRSVEELTETRDVRQRPVPAASFQGNLEAYERLVGCIVRADA